VNESDADVALTLISRERLPPDRAGRLWVKTVDILDEAMSTKFLF
jgi:hypothetical protein